MNFHVRNLSFRLALLGPFYSQAFKGFIITHNIPT